jgi:PPM family protein phosphatase
MAQEAHNSGADKAKKIQLEYSWASDIGRRRSKNQDSAGSFPALPLFVVADGMGGHKGGEVASQIAVQTISQFFLKAVQEKHPFRIRELLQFCVTKANETILKRSKEEPELEGMGTTTTLLTFQDGKAVIGQVGDSRCYLIRRDGVWQLTKDHSLVYEKLRAGLISRDQLKTDKMKNVITRSVGFDPNLQVEFYDYTPHPGDLFLLCSDGLTGQLEDHELFEMAQQILFKKDMFEQESRKTLLTQMVEALIQNANDRGGDDNITVMLIQYLGGPA